MTYARRMLPTQGSCRILATYRPHRSLSGRGRGLPSRGPAGSLVQQAAFRPSDDRVPSLYAIPSPSKDGLAIFHPDHELGSILEPAEVALLPMRLRTEDEFPPADLGVRLRGSHAQGKAPECQSDEEASEGVRCVTLSGDWIVGTGAGGIWVWKRRSRDGRG